MKYRKLGNTGIEISEIGFGTWGIGGLSKGPTSYGKTDDNESKKALEKAFELGINFYDTSNIYGDGHSEELIGEVFRSKRDKIIIASKVGFLEHNGPQDFSSSNIGKSLEGSLKRLKTNYLDLYQLHSPGIKDIEEHQVIETMKSLKETGKIRAIGISIKSPGDGLTIPEEYNLNSIQVNFNLVDQRASKNNLLKICSSKGIGVICRTPLCFGFLSGNYSKDSKFGNKDHRSTWPTEQIERWTNAYKLFTRAVSKEEKQTNAQLALRFCLSYPEVSSVIPGMLSEVEVKENIKASELGAFNDAVLEKLEEIYNESEFFIGKDGIKK